MQITFIRLFLSTDFSYVSIITWLINDCFQSHCIASLHLIYVTENAWPKPVKTTALWNVTSRFFNRTAAT